MMTKGQVSKHLNAIFEAVDALEDGLRDANISPRCRERFHVIRDCAVLVALDLRLPIQPHSESSEKKQETEPVP